MIDSSLIELHPVPSVPRDFVFGLVKLLLVSLGIGNLTMLLFRVNWIQRVAKCLTA